MASTASLSFAASLGAPRRPVAPCALALVPESSERPSNRAGPIPPRTSPAPAQIVVFGSNGKTGARCVQYAARAGIPSPLARARSWSPQNINHLR